jgi:hypothetical protein
MWDGRYQKNNRMVSPGIYFYSCEVYEYRLTGIEARHLHGVIHVYPDKESSGQPIPNE